jgi:hypothetical protein
MAMTNLRDLVVDFSEGEAQVEFKLSHCRMRGFFASLRMTGSDGMGANPTSQKRDVGHPAERAIALREGVRCAWA